MKINIVVKVIMTTLLTITLSSIAVTSVSANSDGHDSTPKSMRGTWYSWVPKSEDDNGGLYKDEVPAKLWFINEQGYNVVSCWREKFHGKTGYSIGGGASTHQGMNVLTKVKVSGKYYKVVVSYTTYQLGDNGNGSIQYNFRNKSIAKKYGKKHAFGYGNDYGNKNAQTKKKMKKVIIKYFGKKQYVDWLQ
ncbi:hypothetical protein EQG49_01665 [Periweissella cryptocerci]|uniref:Uncharacterized protein n=1 Tax=Periweissella cryptocerci TaxID=2506420 RepID=A0A4P6YRI5_9LACO|nr:hypothetical protein [Periweissella cryptocerci]QBO35257.1 hypothetical protein EQG49_01665 [Periweissella cryptocerci]